VCSGGSVDAGESVVATLTRAFKDETGYDIEFEKADYAFSMLFKTWSWKRRSQPLLAHYFVKILTPTQFKSLVTSVPTRDLHDTFGQIQLPLFWETEITPERWREVVLRFATNPPAASQTTPAGCCDFDSPGLPSYIRDNRLSAADRLAPLAILGRLQILTPRMIYWLHCIVGESPVSNLSKILQVAIENIGEDRVFGGFDDLRDLAENIRKALMVRDPRAAILFRAEQSYLPYMPPPMGRVRSFWAPNSNQRAAGKALTPYA